VEVPCKIQWSLITLLNLVIRERVALNTGAEVGDADSKKS
jgi:hypothetical protein